MGMGGGKKLRRVGAACAAAVFAYFVFLLLPAPCADYPRRLAIAPFVPLAADNILQTVSVLPRLLSSRLMALAGAEVVLLAPGEKPPADQAREAGMPLLVQGSVAKLGKGYSIDVTVQDLGTGKPAGAFFAAAGGEDEIIPQIGLMAGEIAEKLFGVKQAPRAVQAPAPATAAPAQAVVPPAAPGAGSTQAGTATAASALPAGAPAAAAPADREEWVPTSLKKISESDKIVDELYGVATIEADKEGNGEVVAYGKRTLYFYRVKGKEFLPAGRIVKGPEIHILSVDTADADGDGKMEVLAAAIDRDRVASFVVKKKGEVYEEIAGGIGDYLAVLPDWEGKRVIVGQRAGIDTPFQGRFRTMTWDGKTLKEGESLPADTDKSPLSGGIFGLSSVKFDKEWRYLYIDEMGQLRVVDSKGKSLYKSKETFGAGLDALEYGPFDRLEGKRKEIQLRKPPKAAVGVDGKPVVLLSEAKRRVLGLTAGITMEASRLILRQWDGSSFVETGGTPKGDLFLTGSDFLSFAGIAKGERVVVSAIVQQGGILQKEESRVVLYEVR